MASRPPRCEVVLPVVFDAAVPITVRTHAVTDLGTWINVLVGAIQYIGDPLELAALSIASHNLEVSVTCAIEALLAAPVDDA